MTDPRVLLFDLGGVLVESSGQAGRKSSPRWQTAASDICFFDDLLPNVAASRRIGINAFQVCGLSETEAALRELGIVCDADPP
jgi:FMN phosphatase YigB (HAD superfamily)